MPAQPVAQRRISRDASPLLPIGEGDSGAFAIGMKGTLSRARQRPLLYALAGSVLALVLLTLFSSSSSRDLSLVLAAHGAGGANGVERFIVPDVVAALAADLRAAGVSAAVVPSPSCSEAMALLAPLRDAGVATTCVARPADDPGAVAPVSAVVRLTRSDAPPDLARRLLTAQLVRTGAAGGPAVYAEVTFTANNTAEHAGALHFGSGVRRLWVLNSRVHLATFNNIYAAKLWGSWGGGSGEGSTLEYTGVYRGRGGVQCAQPGAGRAEEGHALLRSHPRT
jgi:hypothetical protein